MPRSTTAADAFAYNFRVIYAADATGTEDSEAADAVLGLSSAGSTGSAASPSKKSSNSFRAREAAPQLSPG